MNLKPDQQRDAIFGKEALDNAIARAANRCSESPDQPATASGDPLIKLGLAVKEACRRLLVRH